MDHMTRLGGITRPARERLQSCITPEEACAVCTCMSESWEVQLGGRHSWRWRKTSLRVIVPCWPIVAPFGALFIVTFCKQILFHKVQNEAPSPSRSVSSTKLVTKSRPAAPHAVYQPHTWF